MNYENLYDASSLEKPVINKIKEELFYDISMEFKAKGFYVESLNTKNPELNQIYDRKFKQKTPFAEIIEEQRVFTSNPKYLGVVHKIIDLHGFSRLSASQALRRIFNCSDRSRLNIIKIMVGRGLHSQNGQVLPKVVYEVARELKLPDPIQHSKNDGFMIMILPVKNDLDEANV